jgi:hypothetical protein
MQIRKVARGPTNTPRKADAAYVQTCIQTEFKIHNQNRFWPKDIPEACLVTQHNFGQQHHVRRSADGS